MIAADDELDDMGIRNRRQRLHEAALGWRWRATCPQASLFAHALENQDVRVDRHADGQHDAGETGKSHRGADAGHDAEDDEDVDRERAPRRPDRRWRRR